MDLCSGGMIWSCCIDKELNGEEATVGALHNASEYKTKVSATVDIMQFGVQCIVIATVMKTVTSARKQQANFTANHQNRLTFRYALIMPKSQVA